MVITEVVSDALNWIRSARSLGPICGFIMTIYVEPLNSVIRKFV
jgi:uncharacterized protein YggT (Ycf19 family)